MLDEEFEQELHFFRQTLVEAVTQLHPDFSISMHFPELLVRLKALAQDDYDHFRLLCVTLMIDEQFEVRSGFVRLLGSYRVRNNFLSMLLIRVALKQKDLRREALSSLTSMATRVVLPQLFIFAEKRYADALYSVRRLVRTPEEIERGITIARKYIDANNYPLREASLFLLQWHSSMEVEAEGVLRAVLKYKDELFIDALKKAPPVLVLGPLKALRDTISDKYAEYHDLTGTIDVLEMKQNDV